MGVYRLTKRSQTDLEEIWTYTANEWSVEQADKYVDGIITCFAALADRRKKGEPVDKIRRGYFKASYVKHLIFYKIAADNFIEIIRILHVSMDIDDHL